MTYANQMRSILFFFFFFVANFFFLLLFHVEFTETVLNTFGMENVCVECSEYKRQLTCLCIVCTLICTLPLFHPNSLYVSLLLLVVVMVDGGWW